MFLPGRTILSHPMYPIEHTGVGCTTPQLICQILPGRTILSQSMHPIEYILEYRAYSTANLPRFRTIPSNPIYHVEHTGVGRVHNTANLPDRTILSLSV